MRKVCMIGAFLFALTANFILNAGGAINTFVQSDGNFVEKRTQLENYLLENITGKSFFVNLCGELRKIVNFDIIGNYEFILDDNVMQRICSDGELQGIENFEASVLELKEKAGDTPLIVVEYPDRGENFIFSDIFHYFGESYTEIFSKLSALGIDVLYLNSDPEIRRLLNSDDYFLKTDGHLSTTAEFYNAKCITGYLAKEYKIDFPMTETVYSPDNYTWNEHVFYGGFVESCGKGFMEPDIFQTFTPSFDTDIFLSIDGYGAVRSGDFSVVMTNGYEQENDDDMYWITNYGQWPNPLYNYKNNIVQQGPKLLIIGDSLLMRSNCFFTLNAAFVTVADPRYFNGKDYLSDLIASEDYDAIVVLGAHPLFFSDLFFPS